ncbi:SGS-domain-containing protein [Anaeromyces robustus]|uniref:SGS-domain-containing protein n=1 Tax=Anaeromyces robustus TaxID=1754192 RepID=A0A1Y1WVG1_9FUNG|nr:SGS-domain-containing protein [Anaeromyces robustus]|eukprot:ORX77530.1 SGS-domain-containing protein [Anaeromyces robustus]
MLQSAADLFNEANSAFIDEEYDQALELYTKAIEKDCSQPEYYLKRCIAYQKVNKFKESINDADMAIKISQGNQKIASKAYLRKGISEFESELFSEAKSDFEVANSLIPNDNILKKWQKKIAEKEKQNPSLFKNDESNTLQPQQEVNATKATEQQSATTEHPQQSQQLPQRVRHEWFQNENYVTISVFIKKVKPETVTIDLEERVLSLTIKLPSGSDFCFDLDPLAHEIIPSESKYSVLSTKIEIKLKKKVTGIKWSVLEGEDDNSLPQVTSVNDADKPSYPSSSKKRYNWDELEKSIEDEKPEGDAALNNLFQQIYRDASDETKRAMMKSYIESNGTCLSTNWDEVKKGKVECKPPEGMVAKPYNE